MADTLERVRTLASEMRKPNLFTTFWLVWRFLTLPVRGRLFDSHSFERLELAHIAKAIDTGHWVEP
jgi:hypothetical protein